MITAPIQDKSSRPTSVQIYLESITNIPVLTRAEEATLIPAAQSGDTAAFERVINSNLRFVVTIAREYENKGMPFADLIAEGNFGLFRALKAFDCSRGTKFITYAKWWIRQCIIYALIYKNHLVRIPQSQLRKINKTRKTIDTLERKLQRQASHAELATSLDTESLDHGGGYPNGIDSLDAASVPGRKARLIDILPDKQQVLPDSKADSQALRKEINLALRACLKKREQEIIRLLFGLDTGLSVNLGEVGEIYGLSRERVRQIRNEALGKLRKNRNIADAILG